MPLYVQCTGVYVCVYVNSCMHVTACINRTFYVNVFAGACMRGTITCVCVRAPTHPGLEEEVEGVHRPPILQLLEVAVGAPEGRGHR